MIWGPTGLMGVDGGVGGHGGVPHMHTYACVYMLKIHVQKLQMSDFMGIMFNMYVCVFTHACVCMCVHVWEFPLHPHPPTPDLGHVKSLKNAISLE